MKKILNYEKTFLLLSDAAVKHGVDLVVKDPIDFVKRGLNVSNASAWNYLKELERRGFITFNYDAVRIASVRLLKKELSKCIYETDNMTRVLAALWKYRRGSSSDPKKQIVHSSFLAIFRAMPMCRITSYIEVFKDFSKMAGLN